MKAKGLSIRQPWAQLICMGVKDIENRTWPTKHRGRIYVHAGAKPDGQTYNDTKNIVAHIMRNIVDQNVGHRVWQLVYLRRESPWKRYYGSIIGEVDIVDCVTESESPWFEGPYGFVLENPQLYDAPIPYRGWLRFFDVSLTEDIIIRAYKVASHNSTVCGYPGRNYDWSLFDWHQETEHDFGDERYSEESPSFELRGKKMGIMKAPIVYADGGLIAPNREYLHVPYKWAENATIYRVQPNPTMEAGQIYRGHLILKQEAEKREDGWYWVLTMQNAD